MPRIFCGAVSNDSVSRYVSLLFCATLIRSNCITMYSKNKVNINLDLEKEIKNMRKRIKYVFHFNNVHEKLTRKKL